jgi:hypothetical protein
LKSLLYFLTLILETALPKCRFQIYILWMNLFFHIVGPFVVLIILNYKVHTRIKEFEKTLTDTLRVCFNRTTSQRVTSGISSGESLSINITFNTNKVYDVVIHCQVLFWEAAGPNIVIVFHYTNKLQEQVLDLQKMRTNEWSRVNNFDTWIVG